ncbi:hypothetical protein DUI87_04060 [Hirundo rustica rustica]|uniref:ribonuclease H n=1 Tax=Hirundo rustica rustica TaxID=333673 RepID=A0A3M0L1P4_HIRRU|nr:hypothetical protein DUI87_04060 [Hirundo rustica rustica]
MEKLLRGLLPELWQNPETAVDNNNLPIRLEHLCSDGEWVSALKQAWEIPLAVLVSIKDAASKALFSIQPDGPFQPYSKIKQLPSEPFIKFVEPLTRAIELQVKKEGAREEVLEEMALANANKQCKAAILSLPMEPAPTLGDVLQQKSPDVTLSDHDVNRPCLTTECLREPFRLQLRESLHLSDTDWHLGSIDLQVPGSWQHLGMSAAVGEAIILHYMDDVLVCAPIDHLLSHALDLTIDSLVAAGFKLQEEKIQRMPPGSAWVWRLYQTNRDAVIPIHNMIRELETQGVVSKTHSPFNSPIWPVRKSDGEWRLTVDYRALNEVTPPLSAAVPDMLELQPQFAFSWRGVQYTWNRLPQGWKHSPTICHGQIQAALEKGEAPEHLQYINDIIVWGNTAMEVFEKGEKIIQILLKAGFAIKQSKVKGPAREIQFLGVKWHDGRRQIPTEVINKITAMSPPTSKKETQAFLGAIGFWRMDIPEYNQIVSPLYRVTRKKNDFHWVPEPLPR